MAKTRAYPFTDQILFMPFVFIAHYEKVKDKEIEIVISWDIGRRCVEGIVKVSLLKKDHFAIPITDLVENVNELRIAINSIVERAPWEMYYLETIK